MKKTAALLLSFFILNTSSFAIGAAAQVKEDYKLKIIDFGAHLQSGIFLNSNGGRGQEANGPYYGNVSSTEFALNQFYVWFGREAAVETNAFDWGMRFDLSYGNDHYSLAALGADYTDNDGGIKKYWDSKGDKNRLGAYSWAVPQLYLEAAAYRWKLKAGHFHSHLGYESMIAPEADFYSRTFYSDTLPATLTGAVLSREFASFNIYGGAANGLNTAFENSFNDYFFIAGAGYSFNEETFLEYHFIGGRQKEKEGRTRLFLSDTDRFAYFHNMVFEWAPANLRLVTEAHYSYSMPKETPEEREIYKTYGLSQYAVYNFNDKLSAGLRLEYLKNDYPQYFDGDFEDAFSATANITWRPLKWVYLRPEIRYSAADKKIFNLSSRQDYSTAKDKTQLNAGVELTLSF